MRKLKITSLILVVVMLLGMIPMGIFSASAAVAAPTTVPSGTDGVNWEYTTKDISASADILASNETHLSSAITYRWRGMDGFLLNVQTTAVTRFFLQVPFNYGSFGWASYMRISMAQNNQGMNKAHVGSLESDAYVYDGTTWTKQTTNNWGDNYIDLPANFDGYVYVPFDQFYWQGNGNNGNVNNGTTPFAGSTAEYFLSHFENPSLDKLKFWTDTDQACTVKSTQIVYADQDLAPEAGDIAEPYEWVGSPSATASKSKLKDYKTGDYATYTVGDANTKPGVGAFVSVSNTHFDLSDVKGVSVHVDTTGLAAGQQLQFRPYLQYDGGFSDTIYRDNMIVHATANVNNVATTTAGQNFYNTYYADESFCQFVTRTPGSVVYLREDGKTEWTVLFNYCTGAGIDSWGGFKLPAGFKGDVYVPMDSYWFCSSNNGGPIIIPFKYSHVKDFRAFGLFNAVSNAIAEGETNTVTYSDYTIWRDASYNEVEIDTADELVYFFDHLNEYDGKTVKLMNDIVLNAGWDAASGTAPAVKLANRTAANTYFAGTFDGQGHVISGLYLESNLNALGLFGNVKHHTKATVKNVTILNSVINQTNTGGAIGVTEVGLSAAAGSIFGQVMGELTVKGTWIDDPNYTNKTHAYINNVYADVDIKTAAKGGNGMTGYGGLVGLLQSDLTIAQSTYAGNLKAYYRGAAGFVGSIYPYQPVVDHDHDGATVKQSDGKYYKNNDMSAGVGTENKATNGNQCNLEIYESSFTGSVWNAQQGFTGGVIGYNNTNQCNVTLGDVIIAGSIKNIKDDGKACASGSNGFIQGGSWASSHGDRVKGHGNENADYRLFRVTAYDVADDTAVQAFGQTNGALRVWYNDINIDWNADGNFTNAEQKFRNAIADINKCIYVATPEELPKIINRRDFGDTARFSLTLEEDLTFKVKLPVGSVVLAPGVDINDVAKVQVDGTNTSIKLQLSDDLTYWEADASFLPQDITQGLRLAFTGAKFDPAAKVRTQTIHDKSDAATWGTSNTSIAAYLQNLIADEALSTETHDLAIDILKYASATREFHGLSKIDTSKLEGGAEFTVDDIIANAPGAGVDIDNPENAFVALAFRCDSKLAVQIKVSADGAYTATLDGEDIAVDTTKAADEGYILIYLNPLAWDAELQVVDPNNAATLYYYLGDYFAWVLEDADEAISQRQKDVVTALYGYMLSAQAYVASIAE